MIRALLLSSLCAAALAVATPALADAANLLGVFKNWTAYSTGSGDSMTCYAMSKPRATQPRGAKRGDIYPDGVRLAGPQDQGRAGNRARL